MIGRSRISTLFPYTTLFRSRSLTYRETAHDLPSYLEEMRFTHVEFLPIMEHPYSRSWGYQTLGYFAPTSRFGIPEDFMHLVDRKSTRLNSSHTVISYAVFCL